MTDPTPGPARYVYDVTALIKKVDGDTADLRLERTIDFGFRLTERKAWEARFRFVHIDTWETHQPGGPQATADTNNWILAALAAGVLQGETFKTDVYGRWLIDLWRTDTGEHLVDYLKGRGDAKTGSRWND